MTKLNIGFDNNAVWAGCNVESVAGRYNLTTPIADAINVVGANVAAMNLSGDEIEITGGCPVPITLIVYHVVLHRFKKVWYRDGKGDVFLVAAHG